MVIGCRVVAAVNSSSRVSSSWTGRPVRRTASATMSSVSISCFPPNPPPTRLAITRTWSAGSPKSAQSASLVRNGTCVDVRSVSRARPVVPVSRASRPSRASPGRLLHPLDRERPLVHLVGAGRSPARRHLSAGGPRRRHCPARADGAGARRPQRRLAGGYGGADFVVDVDQAQARSAVTAASATTAATRWPWKRTTRSRTIVS